MPREGESRPPASDLPDVSFRMPIGKAETLQAVFERDGVVGEDSAVCPHCGVVAGFVQHAQNNLPVELAFPEGTHAKTSRVLSCRSCKRAICTLSWFHRGKEKEGWTGMVAWPPQVWPDNAPGSLPKEIKCAYDEARFVLPYSPRAAAVLARRCVQHCIQDKLNIKCRTLAAEIREAVKRPELTLPTQQALDHVREIGNWGAHPKNGSVTDSAAELVDSALTILEVSRAEAEYTLEVTELLFHDLYALPERIAAMSAKVAKRLETGNNTSS